MLLYHYTTLEALLGILGKEKICFHGSRYDSMNDPVDYLFAKDIIIPKAKLWCDENLGVEEDVDDEEIYPYIVSFSEHNDNLNLWRFYHSEVCLELDGDIIKKECTGQGIQFSKCFYISNDENEVKQALFEIQRNINIQNDKYQDFLRECSVFIKNKDYEAEGEWRTYKADGSGFTAKYCHETNDVLFKDVEEIPQDIKVRGVRNNDIVLYKEFDFSKKILKGIIIHEQSESAFEKLKRHLELILMSRGYKLGGESIRRTKTLYSK